MTKSKLTRAERRAAVIVGWQAECAVRDATHLVNSLTVADTDVNRLPISLAGCLDVGRRLLREHLATR